MGFLKLDFDILSSICMHLGISDVKNLCGALKDLQEYENNDTLEALLRLRFSPISYFGKAFGNPHLILSTMLTHGVVLAGPKATEYFHPSFDDKDCYWDFYISADTSCMKSALLAFQECGIVWNCERSQKPVVAYLEGYSKVKSQKHKVRLTRQRYSTAIDCVIRSGFDCLLFGQGAMSLYPRPALVGDDMKKAEFHQHPIQYRRLGDEGCETVEFTPYFGTDLEPFLRYLNFIATSKQWMEYEGKITPVKFPTVIFGEIQNGLLTTPRGVENPSPIDSMKKLPFSVYVDAPASYDHSEGILGSETVCRFVDVGLGGAASFFGNYTATLPI